jgi:hypothetical protein
VTLTLETHGHGSTIGGLVPQVRELATSSARTEMNRLATGIDDSVDELVVDFTTSGLRPGSIVELGDELVYVWDYDRGDGRATIQRGMHGTTPVGHDAKELILVEPRFSRRRIVDALVAEVRSWPTSIFAIFTGELEGGARSLNLFGLDGIAEAGLLRVQQSSTEAGTSWPVVGGARLERRQDPALYPSGYALVLPEQTGGRPVSGRLRVTVGVPFPALAVDLDTDTDLGVDLGVRASMLDIAVLGAVGRLPLAEDVSRTQAQAHGRARPAEEVQVGSATGVARAMWEMRDQRLREEAARLVREGYTWRYET